MIDIWNKKILNFGIHLGGVLKDKNNLSNFFALGSHENFLIFNVEKLINNLVKLNKIIYNLINKNGQIFFIETRSFIGFKEVIQLAAQQCQTFFIGDWTYGIITNKLMTQLFLTSDNDHNFFRNPSLVFLPHINHNEVVINELIKKTIPIVGITDSDSNIWNITYPLSGNSESILSLLFFTTFIELAITKAIFINIRDNNNNIKYQTNLWKINNKYSKKALILKPIKYQYIFFNNIVTK